LGDNFNDDLMMNMHFNQNAGEQDHMMNQDFPPMDADEIQNHLKDLETSNMFSRVHHNYNM